MSEPVVLTGVGVVASLLTGGWESFAAYLDAPRPVAGNGGADAPAIEDTALAALVDEAEARRLSRVCRLAVAAARLALADAGVPAGDDLGLVVGTEFGDLRSTVEFADGYLDHGAGGLSALLFPNTVMNTMAAATAIAVGARAASFTLNAPSVAGELAVARAAAAIGAGRVQRVIAGGIDEEHAFTSWALAEMGAGKEVPGENATLLVLESRSSARARGARILAEVRGVAWGALPAHPHAVGRTTASRVIDAAARAASVSTREIGWVYTSESRDVVRARWERSVLEAAFDGCLPASTALARLVGHGAGAGSMRVAAAAWTTRNGRLPGPAEDAESSVSTRMVTGGPGLVHGLARGGTQVALVVAPARD